MAISSSGAVSFANVQTEYGGSNPISLNEYYSGGSLVKANTSSTNTTNATGSSSYTITSGKTSYTQLLEGWADSNTFASGQTYDGFSNIGDNSASIAKISGADLTGNSGAIPSSGTIDMNKFRGTNAGTDNTFTCYGVATSVTGTSPQVTNLRVLLAGHLGTNGQTGSGDFSGMPFTSISIPANGTFTASTAAATGSGNSGSISQRNGIQHFTASNIGNYTVLFWLLSAGHTFSGSGNITVTFNF